MYAYTHRVSHMFLTGFSQVPHRVLTEFSQGFSQVSHKFLTGFSQIYPLFSQTFSQVSYRDSHRKNKSMISNDSRVSKFIILDGICVS